MNSVRTSGRIDEGTMLDLVAAEACAATGNAGFARRSLETTPTIRRVRR